MYGYQNDETPVNGGLVFGLNSGATMKTFGYTANGGKDGAEQEALDIVFTVNGKDVGYRQFPVTRAYDKDNNEVSDPESQEMIDAFKDFNAKVTQILKCYVKEADVIKAFSQNISSFKEYCDVAAALLPANYPDITLDIFAQYQYNIKGNAKQTYLELPKNMKHGKFIVASVAPQDGPWNKTITSDGSLHYVDGKNNVHPFVRSDWFMNSGFANQQKEGNSQEAKMNATNKPQGSGNSGW